MLITSSQNSCYKELKKLLSDKSYFFLDNPKLIDEAVKAGHNLEFLLMTEKYAGKTDYGGQTVVLSENLFKTFSNTISSQGLVGVLKVMKRPLSAPKGNFLVLDEVQDPGNVGTLIRSALGADYLDIYLVSSARLGDKVIRSSMGAVFKTRIYECEKGEFISFFKGYKNLITADMDGENVFECKLSKPVGIILGNEGNGVSKELRALASKTVSIPMQNGLESLNVGVAGSILMFNI